MKIPIAKGKKRRTQDEDDAKAIKEHFDKVVKDVRQSDDGTPTRHRDSIPSAEVVNIMADEIQQVYEALGSRIDAVNAEDKALVLWRDLHYRHKVSAREMEIPRALCKEHS
jgi:hypothetical protein